MFWVWFVIGWVVLNLAFIPFWSALMGGRRRRPAPAPLRVVVDNTRERREYLRNTGT